MLYPGYSSDIGTYWDLLVAEASIVSAKVCHIRRRKGPVTVPKENVARVNFCLLIMKGLKKAS